MTLPVLLISLFACDPDEPSGHDAHSSTGDHGTLVPGLPERFERRLASASPEAVPDGLNAVQNEMLLLTRAMQVAIAAVGSGELSSIPGAFHAVHKSRSLTVHAIEAGAWKPAKGDVSGFIATDEAFHARIVSLLTAAEKNDRAAAASELSGMIQACEECHAAYRP